MRRAAVEFLQVTSRVVKEQCEIPVSGDLKGAVLHSKRCLAPHLANHQDVSVHNAV